jgi:OOP family OmpA-OmpF porin
VVVQAPPPPPVVVVTPPPPPPPPERRRVSFSAESLFGFDQSTIMPAGKAALDTFAGELRGTTFDVVVVEGHTDRLGSEAYNQKLSAQRAETVRNYLVNAAGLEAAKVSAVGKGESQPVTAADACKGSKATRALIACLQPDRRVDVEVTGTR